MSKDDKLALVASYKSMGKATVSPVEAAAVLGCTPYALNVAARQGSMQRDAYFFAGRNLRISLGWLEAFAQGL